MLHNSCTIYCGNFKITCKSMKGKKHYKERLEPNISSNLCQKVIFMSCCTVPLPRKMCASHSQEILIKNYEFHNQTH